MTPYLVGAILAFALTAIGWGGYEHAYDEGFAAGQATCQAAAQRERDIADVATAAAASAAAAAISKIEVRNVTVNKALEREVLTREVFRECHSGDAAVQLLNATPGISRPGASGPGRGKLPASDAAG